MTPPKILDGRRQRFFQWLLLIVTVQAAALAAAAIATRAAFGALHDGIALPSSVIAGLAMAGLTAAGTQVCIQVLAERLGQDYAGDVREALFDHASRSSQADLQRRRFGYHLLRFTGDLSALTKWPGLGLPHLVQAGILLPTATGVLWLLDPVFGWIAAGLVTISALAMALSLGHLFSAHGDLRKRRAKLAADMAERVPVAPQLAAAGRRTTELRRLSRQVSKLADAAIRLRSFDATLKLVPEALAAVAACLILWFGARDGIPAATIAAALAALGLTLRPLLNAARAATQAAGFRTAHAKLSVALNRPLMTSTGRRERLRRGPICLQIKEPAQPPLDVPAGSRKAFALHRLERLASILTGAEAADGVDITLNGIAIQRISQGSLRRAVAVISDTPLILKGSLRKNLTVAIRKRPGDAEIIEAIETAGLRCLLDRLGGLDRTLSERGADLNAAERLDLCRLRLVVQNPAIVIVADATNVDPIAVGSEHATLLTALSHTTRS